MNEKTERTSPAPRAAVCLTSIRSRAATGLAMLALTFGGALLSACPGPSFSVDGGGPDGGGPDGGDAGTCSGSPSSNPSVLSDDCGVFVALWATTRPGRHQASPYQTLARAIEAAGEKGAPRVFACGGTYAESVVIPGGLELYGSLACPNGSWAPGGEKTVIAGFRTRSRPGSRAEGRSSWRGSRSWHPSAKVAGGSSIAVLAEPTSVAELRGCELTAGDGARAQRATTGTTRRRRRRGPSWKTTA
jgi:hypothetical protein